MNQVLKAPLMCTNSVSELPFYVDLDTETAFYVPSDAANLEVCDTCDGCQGCRSGSTAVTSSVLCLLMAAFGTVLA